MNEKFCRTFYKVPYLMTANINDDRSCNRSSNENWSSLHKHVKAIRKDRENNLMEFGREPISKLFKQAKEDDLADNIPLVTNYIPLSGPSSEPLPAPYTQLEIMFDML